MSSWFAGAAKDWNTSLQDTLNRAASSVQKIADQAELQQLGERVRASAQSLAEQGEAALRDARHSFASGAAGPSAAELAKRFRAESAALSESTSASEVVLVLKDWAVRLRKAETSECLKALLQSKALLDVVAALARSEAGRTVIREAARIAEEKKTGEPDASTLCAVLSQAVAEASALAPLLRLVADAAEAAERSQAAGAGYVAIKESSQDFEWVLMLLAASLLDPDEVALQRSRQAIKEALMAASVLSETQRASGAGTQASIPEVGASVWAQRQVDGKWYRAEITAAGTEQVEARWLQAPDDVACGQEAEYVTAATGDTTPSASLPPDCVMPSSCDRPAPAAAKGEEAWQQAIESADVLARNFRELRELCEQEAATSPKQQPEREAMDKSLSATIQTVVTLREKQHQRTMALADSAKKEECDSKEDASQQEKLAALQKEQESLDARKDELVAERQALLDKLQALDKELASVSTACEEARRRCLEVADTRSDVARQHELLMQIESASQVVEESLARRRRSSESAESSTRSTLADACIKSEHARRRQLEELLAGFHAAIWSPEATALSKQSGQVAALRAAHARAEKILEHAWRETVQLAAEALGDGGALAADSEEMSRAAKRYKELRQELEKNMARLAKIAAQGQFQPPGRAA